MRISAVIVNYRTGQLTVDCLRSIVTDGWLPQRGRVIVVDNASGDDSVEIIERAVAVGGWQDWVEVCAAERNGGFAYGNNVGIHHVLKTPEPPAYVLLLNPDTIVRPDSIETLVRFMDEHTKAGIVGGRLLDAAGTPQCSGFRFPSVLGELESGTRLGLLSRLLRRWVLSMPLSETPTHVDWVSGACFLIRRSMMDQIGLLDENFFMYYEEVDYCRKAKLHNWEVWHVPQAEVAHFEGAASGINAHRKPRPRYWYDSRRRYFCKNHGRLYAATAELAFQAGYLTWQLRRALQGKPDTDPRGRLRDGWRYVVLPSLLGQ